MLRNERGNSLVDYLMITAMVAGIAIPIASKYFAGPLLETFNSQRGRLVEFVAQNGRPRKPTVPTPWFSAERQANVKTGSGLSAPGELPPTGEITMGEVKESGNIGQATISQGDAPRTGTITEGTAGGGANIGQGGSGGGARGGGGGAGLDRSNSLSGDFFGKKEGEKAEGDENSGGGGRIASRAGSAGSEGGGGGGAREAGAESQKSSGSDGDKPKEESGLSTEKKREALINQAQKVERERSGKFDWWLLVKILIIALILFLAVLILLSNLKRR